MFLNSQHVLRIDLNGRVYTAIIFWIPMMFASVRWQACYTALSFKCTSKTTGAMFVQQQLFIIEDWKETEIWNDWQTQRPKTILFSFIFKASELGRQAVLFVSLM